MKYLKYFGVLACLFFLSCNKEVLNRPPLTSYLDNQYWRNEDDVRMAVNTFYPYFFSGFNTSSAARCTPLRGYTLCHDVTGKNAQANFESSVPASRGSTGTGVEWIQTYAGPNWNFAWIRGANILMDRLNNVVKPN